MDKNEEFKEVSIKNRVCYYFDDIIEIKDFDFDNISFEEKSYENILIYKISYKPFIGVKPLCIMFEKVDGFLGFVMELDIYYYLTLKKWCHLW